MIQIQRLNMDNAWWVNMNGITFLIDPWLTGSEVDYFKWFNEQWLKTPPLDFTQIPAFDFVIITQKYPDHFHEETLKQLQPSKIIVPKARLKRTHKLLPSATILPLEQLHQNVYESNLNLHFFPTKRKIDPIYDALLLEDGQQSIFIATHGFDLDQKQLDYIRTLPDLELIMCPFNYYKLPALLGGLVSPGVEAAAELLQKSDSKKIVATHDENKIAKGMVSKFAKVEWAAGNRIQKETIFKDKFMHIQDYNPVTL